jgi:hypothetical protein
VKNSKELTRDRQNKFQIYLGEREVDLLREKAESYGMTRSEYLRNLIVFGSVRAPSKLSDSQFQDLLNELNHIGVNINQIARRVNEARNADREDFDLLVLHYEQLMNLFRKWADF